jgi:heme/copper-type cytochrome/quinol oxidase subunit 2
MEPTLQTPQEQPGRPKNWLLESILVTIFCCLPFGIVGIIFASQVNAKYDAGDYAGALRASADAGKWTKIGFIIGLVVIVLWIIIYGTAIFSVFSTHGFHT